MVHLDPLTLLVVVVFFGATLLRSALGFGEALIAVPLLAFVLPVKVAAPIAVLVSITVAAVGQTVPVKQAGSYTITSLRPAKR